MKEKDIELLELKLLTTTLYELFELDYRNYSIASFRRRINNFVKKHNMGTITNLVNEIIHNSGIVTSLIEDISVTTTEMFRDPLVYRYIREEIIPYLRTFPHLRIWHAGLGTGEEIFSLAILLEEEGLLDRCTIYATDINETVLNQIQKRVFPQRNMKRYSYNYMKAGGRLSLSEYYHSDSDSVIFRKSLLRNTTFARHNLTIDSVFVETQLILCRNVMIYFNKDLQNSVLKLFSDSLIYGGILCLGKNETIQFSDIAENFEVKSDEYKIFRKAIYE